MLMYGGNQQNIITEEGNGNILQLKVNKFNKKKTYMFQLAFMHLLGIWQS